MGPIYMVVWGGIDGVEREVGDAGRGRHCGKFICFVIPVEASVASHLEERGMCVNAGPLEDAVANKLQNWPVSVEHMLSWHE